MLNVLSKQNVENYKINNEINSEDLVVPWLRFVTSPGYFFSKEEMRFEKIIIVYMLSKQDIINKIKDILSKHIDVEKGKVNSEIISSQKCKKYFEQSILNTFDEIQELVSNELKNRHLREFLKQGMTKCSYHYLSTYFLNVLEALNKEGCDFPHIDTPEFLEWTFNCSFSEIEKKDTGIGVYMDIIWEMLNDESFVSTMKSILLEHDKRQKKNQ